MKGSYDFQYSNGNENKIKNFKLSPSKRSGKIIEKSQQIIEKKPVWLKYNCKGAGVMSEATTSEIRLSS